MDEIADVWQPVVDALIRAPVAWRTPRQLATALGQRADETMDLLCEMDVAGWLDVRDSRQEVLVSFSTWAVARLGLKLIEVGPGEVPRWAGRDEVEPPAPAAKHVSLFGQSAALSNEGDSALEPILAAELAEEAARRARAKAKEPKPRPRDEDPPYPTALLGLRLAPWPGPRRDLRSVCPACNDRRLEPHMYCLYCDRWGLDPPDDSGGDGKRGDEPGGGGPRRGTWAPSRASLQKWSQRERKRRKDKRRETVLAQIETQRRRQREQQANQTKRMAKDPVAVQNEAEPVR